MRARSLAFGMASVACLFVAHAGTPVWGACVPPPGAYSLTVVFPSPLNGCPGAPNVVEIYGATGGAPLIAGFGMNISITGSPLTITSVAPGFAPSPGGVASVISGDLAAAAGVPAAALPTGSLLATVTFEFTVAAGPGPITVAFGGALPLPTGIVILDHLVVAGCDVLPPALSAPGAAAVPVACPEFIRGDCNNNGMVAGLLGDVIYILDYAFLGTLPTPDCINACDSNDSENIDISDAVYLLSWMFIVGSPAPPPPTPLAGGGFPGDCGVDPTFGPLTCTAPVCP